jgi:hypothetical protein
MSNGHDYNGGDAAFYFVQLGATLLVCTGRGSSASHQVNRAERVMRGTRYNYLASVVDTERHHRHRTAPLTLTATTMQAARAQRQVSVRAQAQRGEDGVEFANA